MGWAWLAVLMCSSPGSCGLRMLPNWPQLIGESELIVVGHLAGEPLRYGAVTVEDGDRRETRWYEGRLIVTEVLKGAGSEGETPLRLDGGMTPVRWVMNGLVHEGYGAKDFPGLAILDEGSSVTRFPPQAALEDARRPAIWMLAHRKTWVPGAGDLPTGTLGIDDPGQVWPIVLLPFVRAVLKPDALDEQLAFLRDPSEDVRRECLRYFRQRGEPRAFPQVAELLHDPGLVYEAIHTCQACGGADAIPHLRPLLADQTGETFYAASEALAELGDRESLPRLVEVLSEGRTGGARNAAAWALGLLGDRQAIPALVGALNLETPSPDGRGAEVWRCSRDALKRLTGCALSPNGDKAERWWQAAQGLSPEAWRHFEIARLIDSLTSATIGPDGQEQAEDRLHELTGWRIPGDRRHFWWPHEYAPQEGQRLWREWLAQQGWTDYQGLPSQTDDELTLTADFGRGWQGTEPLQIRYTVTNRSAHDLWLSKQCYELLRTVCPNGNGGCASPGQGTRLADFTAADFFRLPSGESRAVLGKLIAADDIDGCMEPPIVACAGLVFDRKGTSCGLGAWVGEVWAEPVRLGRDQ